MNVKTSGSNDVGQAEYGWHRSRYGERRPCGSELKTHARKSHGWLLSWALLKPRCNCALSPNLDRCIRRRRGSVAVSGSSVSPSPCADPAFPTIRTSPRIRPNGREDDGTTRQTADCKAARRVADGPTRGRPSSAGDYPRSPRALRRNRTLHNAGSRMRESTMLRRPHAWASVVGA